jgi:hypothetical protein
LGIETILASIERIGFDKEHMKKNKDMPLQNKEKS